MTNRLKGGSYNLLYGRPPRRVLAEVRLLKIKHDLDFLAVQEFSDYIEYFRNHTDWQVVPGSGKAESGIIVFGDNKTNRYSRHTYGDGWITIRGGKFPAAVQHQITINNWLDVRSVHLPTPTHWYYGRLQSPAERKDDLIATSQGLVRFLKGSDSAIALGDWNENPFTTGTYSPRWIANTSNSRISYPLSREGHGRIDYVIHHQCKIKNIFKDTNIKEWSDHEPVIFTVYK